MNFLYRMFQHSKPAGRYSQILDTYILRRPGIFSGALSGHRWRHNSMGKTLDQITDPERLQQLQSHAADNLESWSAAKREPPLTVEVVKQDWGEATLAATKKYGKPYPVLNMANSLFPGGAALEGGSAQEENIWHRTSCALSLLSQGVYFDETERLFLYDNETRKLLRGQRKMDPEQLEKLSRLLGKKIPEAYQIFVNNQRQVCFRGPEVLVPTDFEDLGPRGSKYKADSGMSFALLPEEEIFPFYEFRSAAPELVTNTNINWNDDKFLSDYTKELRRRIGAQLDTLIIHQKPHAILGAWGCGSFKNNPQIIAQIYREEIEKRASYFEHIVFPIIDKENTNNFRIFEENLGGLELGGPKNKSDIKKPPSESSSNLHGFYTSKSGKPTDLPEDKPQKGSDHSPQFSTVIK